MLQISFADSLAHILPFPFLRDGPCALALALLLFHFTHFRLLRRPLASSRNSVRHGEENKSTSSRFALAFCNLPPRPPLSRPHRYFRYVFVRKSFDLRFYLRVRGKTRNDFPLARFKLAAARGFSRSRLRHVLRLAFSSFVSYFITRLSQPPSSGSLSPLESSFQNRLRRRWLLRVSGECNEKILPNQPTPRWGRASFRLERGAGVFFYRYKSDLCN